MPPSLNQCATDTKNLLALISAQFWEMHNISVKCYDQSLIQTPYAYAKGNTEREESNWPDSCRNYSPPKHESTDISVFKQKMLHVN